MAAVDRPYRWVPVLGWMLRDLDEGREDAPLWFGLVVAMLGGLAGIFFGIWGFLLYFLALTPVALIGYGIAVFSAIAPDLKHSQEERQEMQRIIAENREKADL